MYVVSPSELCKLCVLYSTHTNIYVHSFQNSWKVCRAGSSEAFPSLSVSAFLGDQNFLTVGLALICLSHSVNACKVKKSNVNISYPHDVL
jgi:hypothetical protein